MTRTQYYVATSIDGFIADEHNSLGWLFHAESKRNEGQFDSFFSGVGSFAMGATTYEWVLRRHDLLARPERWREWYGDVPSWVFTHRDLPPIPGRTSPSQVVMSGRCTRRWSMPLREGTCG